MKNLKEIVMKYLFLAAACVSILAVALICIFLFANGIPTIAKIGPFNFLLGKEWTHIVKAIYIDFIFFYYTI